MNIHHLSLTAVNILQRLNFLNKVYFIFRLGHISSREPLKSAIFGEIRAYKSH